MSSLVLDCDLLSRITFSLTLCKELGGLLTWGRESIWVQYRHKAGEVTWHLKQYHVLHVEATFDVNHLSKHCWRTQHALMEITSNTSLVSVSVQIENTASGICWTNQFYPRRLDVATQGVFNTTAHLQKVIWSPRLDESGLFRLKKGDLHNI